MAITAGTSAVTPMGAVIIGLTAGIILPLSVEFIDRILTIDDPVGAVSVHGTCGVFGTLAVGLFARDGGLFFGGGVSLLAVQVLGVLAVLGWTIAASFITFKIIDRVIGLRVSKEEELEGLDLSEHGLTAYSDFTIMSDEVKRFTPSASTVPRNVL